MVGQSGAGEDGSTCRRAGVHLAPFPPTLKPMPSPPTSRRRRRLLLTGGMGLLLSMFFLPRLGRAERALGTFATLEIPRRARLEASSGAASEQPDWVGFLFPRYHAWSMGSQTPYRAWLRVNLHRAGAPASSYDAALAESAERLNGGHDEAKRLEKDDHWEIWQGRYRVNTLDEPVWRLAYRDPERRVSLFWQVFQKDWKLPEARAALQAMAQSVRRKSEPDYAAIADRPRLEAEKKDRQVAEALDWVRSKGHPTLQPGVPVSHDGLLIEYQDQPEKRLTLFIQIAGPPTGELPGYVSHGWRTWDGEKWEDQMPNGDYYPSPGIRRRLEETLSKPGPHHFLIRTVRLEEQELEAHHLEDFHRFATNHAASTP